MQATFDKTGQSTEQWVKVSLTPAEQQARGAQAYSDMLSGVRIQSVQDLAQAGLSQEESVPFGYLRQYQNNIYVMVNMDTAVSMLGRGDVAGRQLLDSWVEKGLITFPVKAGDPINLTEKGHKAMESVHAQSMWP